MSSSPRSAWCIGSGTVADAGRRFRWTFFVWIGAMPQFRFEQTLSASEREYVDIFSLVDRRTKPLRMAAALIVGVICLMSPYTLVVGAVLIVLCGIVLFLPRLLWFGARSTYQRSRHLHGALTCGVSDQEMWVIGPSFRCSSTWTNLYNWRESGGWLVLSPNGLCPVFLRREDLLKEGIYDVVFELAGRHAARFGSRQQSPATHRHA